MDRSLAFEKITPFIVNVHAANDRDIQFLESKENFTHNKKLSLSFVPRVIASQHDYAVTRWFSEESTCSKPYFVLVLYNLKDENTYLKIMDRGGLN